MSVRVLVLTGLVTATVGAGFWLNSGGHDSARSLTGSNATVQANAQQLLLEGLAPQALNIDQIRIENAAGTLFSARREGERWLATHLDTQRTFPVDIAPLSDLVSELSEAHILEYKTRKPENYARLGVESLAQDDAQSVKISLSAGDSEWQVLLGNVASNGLGNYARLPDSAVSCLLDGVITVPDSASDWLQQEVLPFTAPDIDSVLFQNQGGSFTIKRSDDGEEGWQLEPIDQEQTLVYPGVLEQTVSDLVEFRYQRVTPFADSEWDNAEPHSAVTFSLKDGSKVFGHLSNADESGSFRIWFNTPDSGHWVSDWVFLLSDFQAQPFRKALDDLVEKPEQ
ncbi:DUF4340 domain-containing protein [Alteromonas aestuariivivens]|uniref:DUF4340 domain-containing protein n=1 Tax=Alteromonas aestuariivivens TaxID=1938339 RepID=A0A3D8MEP4_9ALTE|nr:DUF4340 domain-containing protein [Alteromonas aestuariivivens]RDV29295.1 DUF4340 domain-containing protein [Alteromonas aestuariivivens]